MGSIQKLLEIMGRLRDPQSGCPWDLEQDFSTIAPYTVEEAYEVADAIARNDLDGLRDELGDLLFQVVFHARMAGIRTYSARPKKGRKDHKKAPGTASRHRKDRQATAIRVRSTGSQRPCRR